MGRDSIRFINGVIMRKRVGILVKSHIIVREGALEVAYYVEKFVLVRTGVLSGDGVWVRLA